MFEGPNSDKLCLLRTRMYFHYSNSAKANTMLENEDGKVDIKAIWHGNWKNIQAILIFIAGNAILFRPATVVFSILMWMRGKYYVKSEQAPTKISKPPSVPIYEVTFEIQFFSNYKTTLRIKLSFKNLNVKTYMSANSFCSLLPSSWRMRSMEESKDLNNLLNPKKAADPEKFQNPKNTVKGEKYQGNNGTRNNH